MKTQGDYHGFNIRTIYYDEPMPKNKLEYTTEAILWNVITFFCHKIFFYLIFFNIFA